LKKGLPNGVIQILALRLVRKIVARMANINLGINGPAFRSICVSITNAVTASIEVRRQIAVQPSQSKEWDLDFASLHDLDIDPTGRGGTPLQAYNEAGDVIQNGSRFIRVLFSSLVGSGSKGRTDVLPHASIPPIPRLLHIPQPAELHAYVRALGVLGDHEGIYSLAQWIAEFVDDIDIRVKEESGGRRRMRWVLCAIRVALERPKELKRDIKIDLHPAPQDLLRLVQEAFEKAVVKAVWAAWPGDAELAAYRDVSQNGSGVFVVDRATQIAHVDGRS